MALRARANLPTSVVGRASGTRRVRSPSAMASAVPAPAFVADLPTPREITEVNFTFASKLLKQQKDFADKLFATTAVTEEKKSAHAKLASAKN